MISEWRKRAACLGRDPELWFADDAPGKALAARICAGCEERTACLAAAMELEGSSRFGIWGGLSGPQRAALVAVVADGGRL